MDGAEPETPAATGAERTIRVTVSPSPFRGDPAAPAAEVAAEVAVVDGRLRLAAADRQVAVRPIRATLGHGVLWLDTHTGDRLRLTLAQYAPPPHARQHVDYLAPLYRDLAAAGLRELLVDLRAAGVRLRTSPRVGKGAGGHRAAAWVGAAALLFVELGLYGLPSITAGAIVSGALTTTTSWGDAALVAGLVGFVLLAIAVNPVPVVVRRSFAQGATRDPIRYLDTWSGRPPEADRARPGESLAFVPGRPWPPALFLLVGCVAVAVGGGLTAGAATPEPVTPTGRVRVPEPAWLDGGAIALAGYTGALLLLVVFGISLVRWRRDPEWYSIRWAPLIGAVICFGFGQAGGMPLEPPERWLYLGIVGMVVAFTCARIAAGFGIFAAMAVLLLLAGFGFFDSAAAALPLVPVMVLLAAIAGRYLPGGGRLSAVPAERVRRIRRLVWTSWAVTTALGVGLAVAAGTVLRAG